MSALFAGQVHGSSARDRLQKTGCRDDVFRVGIFHGDAVSNLSAETQVNGIIVFFEIVKREVTADLCVTPKFNIAC